MPNSLRDESDAPPPLDFFTNDFIHPANRALLESEQKRWRLLGRLERWRLRRYVASLASDLRKAGYNRQAVRLEKLRRAIRRAKREYRAAATDEAKQQAKATILAIIDEARPVRQALEALRPTYELYTHYRGWLDYEAEHRRELKAKEKLDRQSRRDMRKEAKWLEQLLRDVWRKTPGCHHTYTDKDSGKEITRVPKFERSQIKPDAHVFYLAASRRWLFGYRWLLPDTVTIKRLIDEEVILSMQAATKRQVKAVWTETGQLTIQVARLDSPDALPKMVLWRDVMRYYPDERRAKIPYPVGVNDSRNAVWWDFASSHHILVAGKSGSGKSNLVNAIVATLASVYSPQELRIVMIDMKGGVEFGHWHELPHVLGDVVKVIDGVKPLLQRLVNIMDRRYALMEQVKAKDITKYNSRVDAGSQFARVLIMIDEMNTFVGLRETTEIHNLITLLASKGRAIGFNIITATQHPDRDVIPGRIKTNMDVRLCGAMPSITASQMVLDGPEAANIPHLPGRFVAQRGLDTLILQVPFVSDDDIAGVVSSCQRAYPEVSEELAEIGSAPKIVVWDEQRLLDLALELLDGSVSGEKAHKLLGDESPGERELRRIAQRIGDYVAANGYIERAKDGSKWTIKRGAGGARLLQPIPDGSGVSSAKTAAPPSHELTGIPSESVHAATEETEREAEKPEEAAPEPAPAPIRVPRARRRKAMA